MVALCLLSRATVAAGFTGLSHTAASVLSSALQPAASLPAPDANVTASIKTAVGQLFSTQRAKDCAAFVALFAPEFSVEDPFGSAPITNASQLEAGCVDSNKVFKTVTVFPAATYVAGYGAGVLWTVKSVATNGCQLDFTGVDAILFNEDILITSLTGFFDANTAAQQMNCTAAPLARRLRA